MARPLRGLEASQTSPTPVRTRVDQQVWTSEAGVREGGAQGGTLGGAREDLWRYPISVVGLLDLLFGLLDLLSDHFPASLGPPACLYLGLHPLSVVRGSAPQGVIV